MGVEVRRKVVVRVAVAVAAFDPNFFAAQAFAQHLEDADLVVDAVDTLARGAILHQNLLHLRPHDPIDGNLGTGDQRAAVFPVRPGPVQGLDHRAVGAVVGSKHQGVQDQRQHAPVVMAIGAVYQGLNPVTERGTAGLALLDQRRQDRLPRQGEKHVPDDPIRLLQCCFGDAEEQVGLALDALDLSDHLGSHAFLGPHRDPMDDLDEEIHEPIRDLPAALPAERRQ